MKLLATLTFAFLFAFKIHAQTITWDGGGDGISWHDANNWNPNQLPGSNDVVSILNDSVKVNTDVIIKQLIVGANAILYQVSPNNSTDFVVQNSSGEGLELANNGKLYVNGKFHLINSAFNGLYLDALSKFIGMPDGIITIDGCNQDGIHSISGATFINSSTLTVKNHGADGLDLHYFVNSGKILVASGGVKGAVISNAANSIHENSGIFQADGGLNISASLFTNTATGEIKCTEGGMSVTGNFINEGNIILENPTGNNLFFSNSHNIFDNYGTLIFRNSNTDNVRIASAAKFYNHAGAVFDYVPNTGIPPLSANVFALVLQNADSKFINEGDVDLNLLSKREGVKSLDKATLENSGTFTIRSYYQKGFIGENFGSIDTLLHNKDSGIIKIGPGIVQDAVAFSAGNRNKIFNDPCADIILGDSLFMSGIALAVQNNGFMEIEKFEITSNVTFNNSGALFIADTSLADGGPSGYLDDFTNTGLVYHPLRGPISNSSVPSIFPLYNASNLNRPYNGINFFADNNGSLINCGNYNENGNTWNSPCTAAINSDTAYFEFQNQGSGCAIRTLTLPFVRPMDTYCPGGAPATVYFTQAISEDWHTAGNWSNNQIPRPCDDVIIQVDKRCQIAQGMTATARTILVEPKAVFETNNNVVFTVDPN